MTKRGWYLHKKGGHYKVTGTATVTTNGEQNGKQVVVYESGGKLYVRDEAEFNEPGRFTFQHEDETYE